MVGPIEGGNRFDALGQYVGTIAGDRLVCRSTKNAALRSLLTAAIRAGSARAQRAFSAIWDYEPDMSD